MSVKHEVILHVCTRERICSAAHAMPHQLSLLLPCGSVLASWRAHRDTSLEQIQEFVPFERGTYLITYDGKAAS